ncbi:MAG: hypothetical protein RLZZ532_1619 [Cyanobacteriota bacterium]|uniref:Uncharacterized protein n=1 Tax=Planktothrix agardhii TaxID=1160 RepID=A0A1J1JHG8_PLAAG|nr:protein of unknown function [Planktothrix agardhii]
MPIKPSGLPNKIPDIFQILQPLQQDIATAKAVRTPDGSWNPDGEVFPPVFPSPLALRARGVWGAVPVFPAI